LLQKEKGELSGKKTHTPKQKSVNEQIKNDERDCQQKMRLRGNNVGIENCGNEVFDKTAFITRFAAEPPEIIFPIRERANPDKILNEKTPDESREMQFPHPPPAQNEQSAKDCKKHEAEMQNQY
jgi:hypothetical protein